MLMNRLKTSTSQIKLKFKPVLPSPANKKSLSKTKDKFEKCSPRANRIPTMNDKKNI